MAGANNKEFDEGCSAFGRSRGTFGSGLAVGDKFELKKYGVEVVDEISPRALWGESKSYSIVRGFQTEKLIGSKVCEISEGIEIGEEE